MTALIKSTEAKKKRNVRGLSKGLLSTVPSNRSASRPIVDEKQVLIDTLRAEISDLKEALQHAKAEQEKAVENAKLKGKEEAINSFQKDERESIELLVKGIDHAQKTFGEKLNKSDALALAIVQTTLKNILDKPENYAEIIAGLIGKQMVGLRRDSILKFRVNNQDFADHSRLDELVTRLSLDSESVELDQTLKSGEVEIDLKLGHVEISIPDLWHEISRKCEDLATEACDL